MIAILIILSLILTIVTIFIISLFSEIRKENIDDNIITNIILLSMLVFTFYTSLLILIHEYGAIVLLIIVLILTCSYCIFRMIKFLINLREKFLDFKEKKVSELFKKEE